MDIVGKKSILGRGTGFHKSPGCAGPEAQTSRQPGTEPERHSCPHLESWGRRKSSEGATEDVKTIPPDT